jgi:DNA-binding response OmpR family regulator
MSAMDAPKRILIADDDPCIVGVLRDFFEQTPTKYIVADVSNGNDALDSARRGVPDLVLLDIKLPGMDGVSVLRELLAIDRRTAVIMLTGAQASAAADALRLGAFAYIPKPFDLSYLETVVSLALDCRRAPSGRAGGDAA